ncbi:interferon alpha-inducible protein 27-like protein 2 [Mytilus californianus]|uniref:interferon alpha-inducible protein 27-like protein 2 n=1 Tax=Mytilus californianus TaxID=6549 RepID=UPI002248304A|nr:interferon alpha-inducible protein 27-like protein 2 [Mytilus californianus]
MDRRYITVFCVLLVLLATPVQGKAKTLSDERKSLIELWRLTLSETYREAVRTGDVKLGKIKELTWDDIKCLTKKYRGSVALGAGSVAATPLVLGAAGFTGSGIAAGSMAARMMAWSAAANGGGVAAGGVVATLQSAGAAGLSLGTKTVIGTSVGGLYSLLVKGCSQTDVECLKKREKKV